MITADVSCRLLEVDFSGIEAVLTGYAFWRHLGDSAGAQQYIRICRLGIHAQVTSVKLAQDHRIESPGNLNWPDDQLSAYLKEIKKGYPVEYDIIKRVDHGTDFGLTPYGMVQQFPEYFSSVAEAEQLQSFLFQVAPALPAWQLAVRKRAREVGYLGGLTLPPGTPSCWDHPGGYRHWFWDVLSYQPTDEVTARKWSKDPKRAGRIVNMHGRWFKIVWGGDSKRAIAFYPQSTCSYLLKKAELRLFHPDSPDYIGDAYFGRTPLLHPIHDALFLHVPNRVYDRVLAIVARVMQDENVELPAPPEWGIGPTLRIGVEAKGGLTWDKRDMHKIPTPPIVPNITPIIDPPTMPRDEADQDEWDALERRVA